MNNKPATVLFLNSGRRVELIRSFRTAFEELGIKGKIVTTDINGFAPALYLGDVKYILPRSSEPDFIERLCDVCRQEKVDCIIPLIDPDLPVLAKHCQAIEANGTKLLLSKEQTIEICRDKRKTHEFLKSKGFPTPEIISFEEAQKHSYPLFIKPRYGSASNNVFKINNTNELTFFVRYIPDAVIQEYVEGDEFTVDVFSEWSGEPIIAIPRRRIKIRAGEVIVGRVERNYNLEKLCQDVARNLDTIGAINIQILHSKESVYITEINPRFGGGCPLSIAAGAPIAKWVILMMFNHPISAESLSIRDGLTTLRFDESFFYPREELLK